ncbi:phosphoribosylglycinamide formyltransferase [Parabacteroides sp. FAFU027]|uniref:phosphoribosylglycinamide formyltransferase n=1 Tax=Parabacteroides sp. FAFU027 TaxID=2922715 RepID=UPI001FB03E93|nr:phosphoribosylglycinamide formyltransferase [Parabacteroides sp. FAFU027]
MKKLAILASGSGSNAENIANYFKGKGIAEITLILSNNPNAYVLERAKKLGIPSFVFTKKEMNETEALLDAIKKSGAEWIILAGFLLKVPQNLLEAFDGKIVNIHPALLPKFGGKGMYGERVHQAVIESGETESGITIHYVNEHYDEGAIIFQAKCPVLKEDTADDVATKVHALEYEYFPKVIEELLLNDK